MNPGILFHFDEHDAISECFLLCDTDRQETRLRAIAEAIIRALTEKPHVCACGGKCKDKAQQRKAASQHRELALDAYVLADKNRDRIRSAMIRGAVDQEAGAVANDLVAAVCRLAV